MSGPRLLILFQSSLETDIHVETSVLLMLSLLPFDILSHKSGKLICNSQHLKLVFELLDGHDIVPWLPVLSGSFFGLRTFPCNVFAGLTGEVGVRFHLSSMWKAELMANKDSRQNWPIIRLFC
ncbi:unnamed protein product [Hymenolepis diminuta]|uniref:Uncharacterized protein n=1 Tax=Hymenolepis diminuta TaxID=6216 RepID=A0A564YXT8_HYMDI|nr:unnamed protein product [Hymenolepis diminuta]